MKITLRELEVLNAVVTAGSISKAGKSLKLSQPTISQKVAKLEEELGTQLLHRGGARDIRLTPAGEFWYKSAVEILGTFERTLKTHETMFGSANFALTFATTNAMQKHFSETVAEAAMAQDAFKRIEAVGFETSEKVVQAITTHNMNCGIVHAQNYDDTFGSFHVEHLFSDRLLWVVPKDMPDNLLHEFLGNGAEPSSFHPAIAQTITITEDPVLQKTTESWYRNNIPFAQPVMNCSSHDVAVSLVKSGLGTSLMPLSYISLLTEADLDGVKAIEIGLKYQDVKFVMQRHLLSSKPFANFSRVFCEKIRNQTRIVSQSPTVLHRQAS